MAGKALSSRILLPLIARQFHASPWRRATVCGTVDGLARQGKDEAKNVAEDVMNAAAAAPGKMANEASKGAATITETAENVKDKAKQTAQDAWDTVKDTTLKVKDTVVGSAEDSKESIKGTAETVTRSMNTKNTN